METVNESITLIAQALEQLKGYQKAIEEHEIWELKPVNDAVDLLEQAISKITKEI